MPFGYCELIWLFIIIFNNSHKNAVKKSESLFYPSTYTHKPRKDVNNALQVSLMPYKTDWRPRLAAKTLHDMHVAMRANYGVWLQGGIERFL